MHNQKGTASEINVRADKLKEGTIAQLQKETIAELKKKNRML